MRILHVQSVILLAITLTSTTVSATMLDELGRSVVFLVATPNSTQSEFGTGFLVVHNDVRMLATAAHVARALSAQSLAVIRAKDGTALQIPIRKLAGTNAMPKWRFHSTADLAILILRPEPALLPQLSERFLPSELLRSEQSAPPRPLTLTVLGFPLALGVAGKFSPISRETKAASDLLTIDRGDTKKGAFFFITQDPSIGDFSGAPIFDTGLPYSSDEAAMVIRSKKRQIVGVVHGNVEDKTRGKLGAVTPAYLLLDLIRNSGAL